MYTVSTTGFWPVNAYFVIADVSGLSDIEDDQSDRAATLPELNPLNIAGLDSVLESWNSSGIDPGYDSQGKAETYSTEVRDSSH